MTVEQAAIAVLGTFFLILCGVISYLWRKHDERMEALERSTADSELARFIARDGEREKHWTQWREALERKLDGYIKDQAEWRHVELVPLLRKFSADIVTMQERQADNMRRIERIERVLNGKLS